MRLACVQADVAYAEPRVNLANAIGYLQRLKADGVELAVFPEAYLTGYCFDDAESATAAALSIGEQNGPLAELAEVVEDLDIAVVIGFAERADGGLFNTAALLEPGAPARYYRKSHLPELGLDKHVRAGDFLEPFDTRFGRIGVLICFDLRFPEAARSLALRGADLIVLPTNWPQGAELSADTIALARAAENRVIVATCDRVGEERGFRFIGRSKIIDPSGRVLASAGDEERILVAEVDLAQARAKRVVNIPGRYETETFAARRPELYGALTQVDEPASSPEASTR